MMSQPAELFETKSDFAYRQVRDRILSGELQPGAVIQQRELASRIGISTTPLREALRRLKSEGLVELDAHRDARISPLRAEEARDLLEMRKSLDPLAAGLAAQRRTNADIQAIRAALALIEPLPTPPAVSQLVAHRNFHAAIYRASHNDLLIDALEGLWDKADRYRRLALQTERTQAARDQKAHEHQTLVDFIAAGNSDGAANAMRAHIDTSLGATAVWRLGHEPTGEAAP
jgi:DNA-binding GntR family transcriptional regulator